MTQATRGASRVWPALSKTALALSLIAFSACAPAQNFAEQEEETVPEGTEYVPASEERLAELEGFKDVEMTESQKVSTLANYSHLDPGHVVPDRLLEKAVQYYDANSKSIKNKAYLTVIDFSKNSKYGRMFVINMSTGSVWTLHTAHGKGSDSNHDGIAEKFSNVSGSGTSSLGYYLTAETYSGKHGLSLRLDGLSSTNSNVRRRAIVVHGASYVYDTNTKAGRSLGCPAVSNANKTKLINMIKGGSLMYAGT